MIDIAVLPRLGAMAPIGIAARLGDLRRELESSEDWPGDMTVNAALFLNDVCRVLGLSDVERETVLGANASAYVVAEEDARPAYYLKE